MAIGDILAAFPTVKPGDLEITTQGLEDGVALRVRYLPTGAELKVRGLKPDTFDLALRTALEQLLQEVTATPK